MTWRVKPTRHKDLICFSHLRWDFVFQRPQHLMTRFAAERRVLFFEEPLLGAAAPFLEVRRDRDVVVAVPHLPTQLCDSERAKATSTLLADLISRQGVERPVLWYYTPMALEFSRGVSHALVVYDCMDELSAFVGAPPGLIELERELLQSAAIVFTGGQSLYEAKRQRHPNVHPFPSSVDVNHFARARTWEPAPVDQAAIGRPRIGFHGVIDERMDLALIDEVARRREGWHFVLVGPVVKIDPSALPRRGNIHYLGMKPYDELPRYLAHWDVAMLPFARNESTRFISPTKTPEYLAAGRPVVSTSIADVIRPYGQLGLARIADQPDAFIEAIDSCLHVDANWLTHADAFLAGLSWDHTWGAMRKLVEDGLRRAQSARTSTGRPASAPPVRRAPAL